MVKEVQGRETFIDGKIVLVESITESGKLTAYEAHLEVGGEEKEVKVDPQGKVVP